MKYNFVVDERGKIILAMRWGIEPYEKMTYRTIGMIFEISTARVRQIEAWIIGKLRRKALFGDKNKVHLIINTLGE